jgi:hypothetical protein
VADELTDFLAQPTPENFLVLRAQIGASSAYDPLSEDDERLADLVEAGEFQEAAELAEQLMPNWLLSARVNLLAAQAADQLGETDAAEQSRYLARACIHATLRAGDGTAEHPYPILHAADEYDLLAVLDKDPASQRLAQTADGPRDVFTCADGSEIWFDVGAVMQAAARMSHHA